MTKPSPTRRASMPAAQMRADANRQARDAAANAVAALWTELRDGEPLMVELLLPDPLLRALDELTRANAS